jgi:hypothetical protein
MKIYAKQISPENTTSPLLYDGMPENVYIFGNNKLIDHNGAAIENIQNAMYEAAAEIKNLLCGCSCYDSFISVVYDFLPAPENKNEYGRADRLKWRQLLLAFDAGAIDDDDATTAALEIITGRAYEYATIRGCCQGDWQNIIYPAEYGDEWLKNFEIEYFNLGDEWRITDDDENGYYFYTHEWSNDKKRAEIADAAGVDPSDVVLLAFDGWQRVATYKEI